MALLNYARHMYQHNKWVFLILFFVTVAAASFRLPDGTVVEGDAEVQGDITISGNVDTTSIGQDGADTSFIGDNITMTNRSGIDFKEPTATGTDQVSVKAPSSVSTSWTFQWPGSGPSTDQVMKFNGTNTDWVNFNTEGITSDESTQLENIDSTTISSAQWGYVGAMDQDVASDDDVTFNDITSASQFLAPNGSAATPSISFTGDTDTGIYRSSSDIIGFATGGSSRAFINDNGLALAGGNDLQLTSPSEIKFFDGTGIETVGFQSPDSISSTVSWKLPDADGSSGQAIVTDGSGELSFGSPTASLPTAGSYWLCDVEEFSSSGTWTKGDIDAVFVEVVGGGGGSGGVEATSGSQTAGSRGGSGGGYALSFIDSGLGSTETVTVGAGGSGGAAGNNSGSGGGTSSFGSHLSATGGSGGALSTAVGGTSIGSGIGGGSGSGGNILNVPGGSSGDRIIVSGERVSLSNGGASALSTQAHSNNNGVGTAGNFPGGGAGGSANGNSGSDTAGADGADGVVIVWGYCQ